MVFEGRDEEEADGVGGPKARAAEVAHVQAAALGPAAVPQPQGAPRRGPRGRRKPRRQGRGGVLKVRGMTRRFKKGVGWRGVGEREGGGW